jgi:hypothetical protein
MLPPIWTDPTFVAQEFARVESRLSLIEKTLRHLVALLSTTRDTRPFHYEDSHAALVDLFTRTNIPLSLIRSREFLRDAHLMSRGFSMPSFPELRSTIIEKADAIRALSRPTSENGHDMSLMADGVRAGGWLWQGICIATMRRFVFWRIIQ